jgi:hypothetical protein
MDNEETKNEKKSRTVDERLSALAGTVSSLANVSGAHAQAIRTLETRADRIDATLDAVHERINKMQTEAADKPTLDLTTVAGVAKVAGLVVGGILVLATGVAVSGAVSARVYDAIRGEEGLMREHELNKLMLTPPVVLAENGTVVDRNAASQGGTVAAAALTGAVAGAAVGAAVN